MQTLVIKSERARVRKVRSLITSVGNAFGAVTFRKRSDGSKRKMSFRLHVVDPSYASKPKGKRNTHALNDAHDQMTVFDCNLIRYGKKGKSKDKMNGRGDWRTIPLETVERLAVNGEIYKIVR